MRLILPKIVAEQLQRDYRDAQLAWSDRRKESLCAGCGEIVRGQSFSTTLIYWRDGPRDHSHDPNDHQMAFRCECGHEWMEKRHLPCPVEGCKFNEPIQSSKVSSPTEKQAQ